MIQEVKTKGHETKDQFSAFPTQHGPRASCLEVSLAQCIPKGLPMLSSARGYCRFFGGVLWSVLLARYLNMRVCLLTQLMFPHNLTPWCPFHFPLFHPPSHCPPLFQLSLPSKFSAPGEIDEAFKLLNQEAGSHVQFSAVSSGGRLSSTKVWDI